MLERGCFTILELNAEISGSLVLDILGALDTERRECVEEYFLLVLSLKICMIPHKNIPVIKLRRSFLKFHPNFDHGINSKSQCHILVLSCRQKTQRFNKSTDISPELSLFFCS